ncbi:MAG TPA: choice-of-anchor D domain-containing protein [Ktedonobacterales bacterium]|nr:choice-of-anchor D domain-containing protein [Ktedonobacterales bacterium]
MCGWWWRARRPTIRALCRIAPWLVCALLIPGVSQSVLAAPPIASDGPQPVGQLSAHTVNFGVRTFGTTSAESVTLMNVGVAALHLRTISGLGDNFGVTGTCPTPITLDLGASCVVTFTFSPSVFGPQQARAVFVDDAAGDQTVALLGQGSASIIVSDATQVNFGTVFTGDAATRTLTLTNRGDLDLNVYGVWAVGEGLRESDTCAGGRLVSGATCAVTLTYAPTRAGSLSADLRVESNATSSPLIAQIAGVAVAPIVAMSAAPLDFGRHPLGSYSWQSFVVSNTGTEPLTIAEITLSDDAPDYAITSDACSLQTVAPGASCAVMVRFTPTRAGDANATLSVRANMSDGVATYRITGSGTAAPVVNAPTDVERLAALRMAALNQRLWLTILAETGYLSVFCLLMSLLIRLRWRRLRRSEALAVTVAAVTMPLTPVASDQTIATVDMNQAAGEPVPGR